MHGNPWPEEGSVPQDHGQGRGQQAGQAAGSGKGQQGSLWAGLGTAAEGLCTEGEHGQAGEGEGGCPGIQGGVEADRLGRWEGQEQTAEQRPRGQAQ